MSSKFAWTNCYMEVADKVLQYKNNRRELLQILEDIFNEINMKFPYMENGEMIEDICPFTVMGSFNRGIKNDNRAALLKALKRRLGLQSEIPENFDGIPVLNNMKAWFFAYEKEQVGNDIQNLWEMFEVALSYADAPTKDKRYKFVEYYDLVTKQQNVKWNLTMAFYWCRPYTYINLDERNRRFILASGNLPSYFSSVFSGIDKKMPDGTKYLFMCEQCTNAIKNGKFGYENLPELSYIAWKSTQGRSGIKSDAEFLKWFNPVIIALKALGGKATPKEVRDKIAVNLNLSPEEVLETRGKNNANKFANEVAWARNYLAYEGIIDKSERGIWALTDKGWNCEMTDQYASDIFLKWVEINKNRVEEEEAGKEEGQVHFWMYAAGENSRLWDEFYQKGIMGIAWDELGNLSEYASRDEMISAMQEKLGPDKTYKNDSLATWQFLKDMNIGDIVYVKRGMSKVIGRV